MFKDPHLMDKLTDEELEQFRSGSGIYTFRRHILIHPHDFLPGWAWQDENTIDLNEETGLAEGVGNHGFETLEECLLDVFEYLDNLS